MFSRRRDKQPLATRLREVYNDIANSSLLYQSLEETNRNAEALQGWKSLHTSSLYKLDSLDKEIKTASLSAEEIDLLDQILTLKRQSDEHMERLQLKLELNFTEAPSASTHTHTSSNTKSPNGTMMASSNATSRLNVPTLRSNNPQPMKYAQSAQQQKKNKPMMKSLRSTNSNNSSSTTANSAVKQSAQKAASLSWNNESDKISNWAPSTSINTQAKSYSTTNIDEFENFSSTTTVDSAAKALSRSEALQVLESMGQNSRTVRGYDNGEDNLNTNLRNMKLNTKPKPSAAATTTTTTTTGTTGPYVYKQPQIPRFVINKAKPKEQIQTSTNGSATNTRPGTRENSRNHSRTRPSPSPNARKLPAQVVVPNTRPRTASPGPTAIQKRTQQAQQKLNREENTSEESTEKDTETFDNELANDDETKKELEKEKEQEKLIKSLRGVDPHAAKQILNEIIVHGDEVHWDDIAGLEVAKSSLKETVVYPFLRPDLFSGLREPARGMLLFGPPGTGKTMLARAVATESKSTFFSISASSLTSKYLGESEKLVRALFQLAKKLAPSIIFVDEIDSLLSSRNNEGENESSRRIKNEFLVQWSDLTKAAAGRDNGEDLQRVLVLAATNLPWAIDEAARRRFVRRQYIPLPEYETRRVQLMKLLSYQTHTLTEEDFNKLIEITDGYSGSDITALAKDAAMGPLRALGDKLLLTNKSEIRPIALVDFEASLKFIKPSVSKENLAEFDQWASLFGSSGT